MSYLKWKYQYELYFLLFRKKEPGVIGVKGWFWVWGRESERKGCY